MHFHSLFPCPPLFLSFLSSTSSFDPFHLSSDRQHKMTHKGWHATKQNVMSQCCISYDFVMVLFISAEQGSTVKATP